MKKKKDYLKIIDQIEAIRTKNNKNWMDILRVAFKHSPEESAKILSEILSMDEKLLNISKKLTK
tara:strand:- start:14051 stop:14242 length:192 start_codon:yes stop_codon:yes gene_type:complete